VIAEGSTLISGAARRPSRATGPKAVRDRAIIRLRRDPGLRCREVVSLDREYLDTESGGLAVPGKRRQRLAPRIRSWPGGRI
jgi:site-specific recombinase XerC